MKGETGTKQERSGFLDYPEFLLNVNYFMGEFLETMCNRYSDLKLILSERSKKKRRREKISKT